VRVCECVLTSRLPGFHLRNFTWYKLYLVQLLNLLNMAGSIVMETLGVKLIPMLDLVMNGHCCSGNFGPDTKAVDIWQKM
jgi:hypothetical protein